MNISVVAGPKTRHGAVVVMVVAVAIIAVMVDSETRPKVTLEATQSPLLLEA